MAPQQRAETQAPAEGIWRVGKAPDPLAYPASSVPLPFSDPAGARAGNRFDDPFGYYRVLYFGTSRAVCFGETLARFRPSPRMVAYIGDEWRGRGWMDLGSVPADWRRQRLGVKIVLSDDSVFLDAEHPATHRRVTGDIAPALAVLGVDRPLDVALVRGDDRRVTRLISWWAHNQRNADGTARYAGIRYLSRLDTEWEAWVVFDRTEYEEISREPIEAGDADLQAVAALWGLKVY